MFKMASVSYVESDRVSMVQRVASVGVMDGSSLTGISVIVCATLLLLAASGGLFVPGRVVLAFLFVVVLFHRRYRRAP